MKLKVFNPYTQSQIAELDQNTFEEVDRFLEKAFQRWKSKDLLPKFERIKILESFRKEVTSDLASYARLASEEGGKALKDSLVEVQRAIEGIDYTIAVLKTRANQTVPMGLNAKSKHKLALIQEEPIGPVLAISAFNHPFNLIIHQVIPAIAAGCPILVKPASTTPLSCKKIMEALYRAGLPEDLGKMFVVERNVAEKLVSDKRLRFFSFIGSSKVGWKLKSLVQPYVHCAMEHGGTAPAILCEDADIELAVPGLIKAAYYHSGQVCVSLQNLIIDRKIYQDVRELCLEAVKKLRVGDPLEETTDYGPMITSEEKQRALGWIREEKKNLIIGGNEVGQTCIAPTIIEMPSRVSSVVKDEIFAPVLNLFSFESNEEALGLANSDRFSFQSSVYTKDLDRSLFFAKHLDCQTILVNESPAFRVDWMPFGGKQESGFGTGGIPYTLHDYTNQKQIIIESKEI